MALSESLEGFKDLVTYYYKAGARGFLVSGGFNREGFLPISREHIDFLKEFRKGRQVFLSVHLGLAPREIVDKALGAFDLIDYEVPPSVEFIRRGRGVKASLEDYMRILEYVSREYGEDRVAPHIVVNSPLASRSQELEVVREVGLAHKRIMVLLLHADSESVEEQRILAVAGLSRSLFREVSLGCMRPRRLSGLIEKLVGGGFLDRVVNPGRGLVKKYSMRTISACCSIPRHAFWLFEDDSHPGRLRPSGSGSY